MSVIRKVWAPSHGIEKNHCQESSVLFHFLRGMNLNVNNCLFVSKLLFNTGLYLLCIFIRFEWNHCLGPLLVPSIQGQRYGKNCVCYSGHIQYTQPVTNFSTLSDAIE